VSNFAVDLRRATLELYGLKTLKSTNASLYDPHIIAK